MATVDKGSVVWALCCVECITVQWGRQRRSVHYCVSLNYTHTDRHSEGWDLVSMTPFSGLLLPSDEHCRRDGLESGWIRGVCVCFTEVNLFTIMDVKTTMLSKEWIKVRQCLHEKVISFVSFVHIHCHAHARVRWGEVLVKLIGVQDDVHNVGRYFLWWFLGYVLTRCKAMEVIFHEHLA